VCKSVPGSRVPKEGRESNRGTELDDSTADGEGGGGRSRCSGDGSGFEVGESLEAMGCGDDGELK
jgi:hypothetical protein